MKSFFTKYHVHLFFLLIILVGLFTFKDYGSYDDEFLQRKHSIVSYYRIKSTITSKYHSNCVPSFDKNSGIEKAIAKENVHRCLNKYPYRYYGVALQLPLVFIEDIFDFKLGYQTAFYIRHLYTFIIFFLSLICLYKIIDKYIIKNKKYALIAVLLMVLSPRMYGEAFYNIKDSLFMSMSIINLYFIFKYFKNSSFKNLSLLCFISALVINSRIVGGLYIGLAFLYNIIRKRKNIEECIKSSLLIIILTFVFYIIVTPASWDNPLMFPFQTLGFFYNYVDPISKLEIFCLHYGKFYSSTNLPSNYIPTWIFITTPILYIVLFVIGVIVEIFTGVKKLIKKKNSINFELLFCNIILISILLLVIIKRPTLYGGWRHLYFLYPLIIIDALVGLKWLLGIKKIKKLIIVLLIGNSLLLTYWMIKNHPYQYEYYEYIFEDKIVKDFSINYYQTSNVDAVRYILKHDKRKKIKVLILNDKNNSGIRLAKDYKRIVLVNDVKRADYTIDNYIYDDGSLQKLYKEVYTVKLDNKYRLFTVYRGNN